MEKAEINPFDVYVNEYDNWYDENPEIYRKELKILKNILPEFKRGLEIGVGTGRFASELNIKYGIDIALNSLIKAKERGILTVCGKAEEMPFKSNIFELTLFVFSLCFISDISKAINEARRVTRNNGWIIVFFIDRNSSLGRKYEEKKKESKFYKNAQFFSFKELESILKRNKFEIEKKEEEKGLVCVRAIKK